jgi:hypothetical protein
MLFFPNCFFKGISVKLVSLANRRISVLFRTYAGQSSAQRPRVRWDFLVTCLVAAFLISVSANAVELNGRVTSSFYGAERAGDNYWRSYIGFNSIATLWRDDRSRSLGFHTNLRWTGDLAANEPGTPQTYIYDFYFKLGGYPSGSTIYAGRQFVYNSLGSSLIDGLRVRFRIVKSVSLDIFGGATVSQETPDKIQSIGNYSMFGSRIEYSRSRSFRLGLNWLTQKSYGSTSRNRAGIDAWKEIRKIELYGRISYDLLNLDMAGAMGRVTARPDKWYLSAEFDWRKPSVDGNTLFGLIDADAYKGFRAEVTRVLWRDLRLLGQYHRELLNGDDAWRSVLGLRTTHFMIGWYHRGGYGGESNGITGQANINIRHNLELYGSASISRYLIQPETVDKIDAYSSSAGLVWRPGWTMQIRAEGQYLRNAVDKSDFRLFVQLAKNFAMKATRAEAGE